ncbi:MAG: hypothetical protein ABW061_21425 [Polyangiaceae bacterium]
MNRISRTDGGAFTRRDEAWSEATVLGPNEFRVRLGGLFHGAWMAKLSTRLAERELSIDHIHARLTTDQVWIAELHLIRVSETTDPLSLDYAALAADESDGPSSGNLVLDSYRLIESRDYGGTLMLTLEAADSLGLLGALLGRLAHLQLFPVELHIETREGRAYDSLWLAGPAAAPPNTGARDAVAELLDRSRHV